MILTIDIGGTYIKYAFLEKKEKNIITNKMLTPKSLAEFYEAIGELIKQKENIKGVALSCPGKIDSSSGKIYHGGSLEYLNGINIRDYIEVNHSIRCSVINDGKAAALAEHQYGNLKNTTNCAAIILGTGVGGGIILENKLFNGGNFHAGEFSYVINGPKEEFENGNLVGFKCSSVKFIETALDILKSKERNNGELVFRSIKEKKNIKLLKLFKEYCLDIAILISNLQAILDIEKIVIGGGISQQSILIEEIIFQYKRLRTNNEILSNVLPEIKIEACFFRNDANILGALYDFLARVEKIY